MPPTAKTQQPRGPGGRLRVTNRSRLRIYNGSIDADTVVLEEEGATRGLSTAGVDAEDANEHHLQVVLSLQNLDGALDAKQANIPTPAANGIVQGYGDLYQANRWKDPEQFIRFSDVIDECLEGGLGEGYTYDLDEEDVQWLERNNATAKSDGSSLNGARWTRKSKGKEPEGQQPRPFPITEAEFELVMGLMEMVSDAQRPVLHADLSTLPTLYDFEQALSEALSEDYFAIFQVPPDVPKPEQLWLITRAVYPHWRERRIVRGGHRVMPQLNTDETSDVDAFVCFRRRDPKPVRKTRRTESSQTDRFVRLRSDFDRAQELADSALGREEKKLELLEVEKKVYDARRHYLAVRQQHPEFGSTMDDEKYLFPREVGSAQNQVLLKVPRKSHSLDVGLGSAELIVPADIIEEVKNRTGADYKARRAADEGFENHTDAVVRLQVKQAGAFKFQWTSHSLDVATTPTYFASAAPSSSAAKSLVGFRTRRGRGGVQRLDRLLPHSRREAPREPLFTRNPLPSHSAYFSGEKWSGSKVEAEDDDAMDTTSDTDGAGALYNAMRPQDYLKRHFFRPNPPADDPDLEANGMVIVDDFDPLYAIKRSELLTSDDNPLLVDPTYLSAAVDFNKEARAKEPRAPFYAPRVQQSISGIPRISGQGAGVGPPQMQMQHAASTNGQLGPSQAMLVQVSRQAQAQQTLAQQTMVNHQQALFQARMNNAARGATQTPSSATRPPQSGPSPTPPQPIAAHAVAMPLPLPAAVPGSQIALSGSRATPAINFPVGSGSAPVVSPEMSPVQMHSNGPFTNGAGQLPRVDTPVRTSSGQHIPYGSMQPPSGPPAYPQRPPSTSTAVHSQYTGNHAPASVVNALSHYHRQQNQKPYGGMGPGPGPQMMPAGAMQQLPQHYLPPGYTGLNGVNVSNMNLALGNPNINLKLPPNRGNRPGPQRLPNGMDMLAAENLLGASQGHLQPPSMTHVPSANGHAHLSPVPMQGRISPANNHPYAAYTPHSPMPATPSPRSNVHPSKSPLDPSHPPPSPVQHRPPSVAR